jgi:hypothetical protein
MRMLLWMVSVPKSFTYKPLPVPGVFCNRLRSSNGLEPPWQHIELKVLSIQAPRVSSCHSMIAENLRCPLDLQNDEFGNSGDIMLLDLLPIEGVISVDFPSVHVFPDKGGLVGPVRCLRRRRRAGHFRRWKALLLLKMVCNSYRL